MAQNYINSGETINVLLGAGETGFAAGDAYKKGSFVGVILSLTREGQTVFSNVASAENDIAVIATSGVYSLAKDAPLVITQGDRLYWDDTEKEVVKTATGNTFIGFAYADAASAATTVEVMLKAGDSAGESALSQAANVAVLGALDIAASDSGNPTEAEIEVVTGAIQAKVDAVISSLVAAGLMASS